MARLPTPGGDAGNWGEVLNDFLRQEHQEDGTLKQTEAIAAKYVKPSTGIPKADLAVGVQASLDQADVAETNAKTYADTQIAPLVPGPGEMIVGGTGGPVNVAHIDVRAYGAVGDGVTDDTATIQAAIDAASASGGHVFFPRGRYVVAASASNGTGALTITASNVALSGSPGAVLSFPNVVNGGFCILATGSKTTGVTTVSAAITKGSNQITVASATGIAVGDWLMLRSTERFGYEDLVNDLRGEMVHVTAKSGNVLTLDGPTYDSYATSGNTVTLDKLSFLDGIIFRGLEIAGAGGSTGQFGVVLRYCRGARVNDCTIHDTRRWGVQFFVCRQVSATNNVVRNSNESTLGYGITSYGSEGATFTGNHVSDCRHGFDTDGQVGFGAIPGRHTVIDGNVVIGTSAPGINTHNCSEYVTITNNNVVRCGGGIQVRGRYNIVVGNRVYGLIATSEGTLNGLRIGTGSGPDSGIAGTGLILAHNFFDVTESVSGSNTDGIYAGSPLNAALVEGNIIKGFHRHGIFFTGNTNRDVTIRGNHIDGSNQMGTQGSTYVHGVSFLPATVATGNNHKHILIDGNIFANIKLSGVRLESSGGGADPTDNLVVTNNIFRNVFRGLDLNSCDTTHVIFTDNQLPDIATAANAFTGTAKVRDTPVNVRNVVAGVAGGIVGSGSSAPTSGTWRQGDVVLNTSPVSGGFMGWVCTVAGTPGTWKSFGLIS